MSQRDSYYEQQNQGYSQQQYGNGRQRMPRMASEPSYNNQNRQLDPNVYPIPNNHRSYETVASASGSGTSGEPSGYQTDPTSSDNSSVERVQPPPKPQSEAINNYRSPVGQPSFTVGVRSPPPHNNYQANMAQANGYPSQAPGAPYNHPRANIIRKPTAQAMNPNMMPQQQQRPPMGEKRKSWFARRFSRND
jgi:hypothetical protein